MHGIILATTFTLFACPSLSLKINGSETLEDGSCIDREKRVVMNGQRFAPDEDPCKTCYCADGVAQLCTLVQCSPPLCAKWEPISNECCQFRCLDGPRFDDADRRLNRSYYRPDNPDGPGFDLRLALSGTTSLLIVALLIFMVHRLRQRRLLIIMNRISEEQHCIDHDDSPFPADEVAGFDFLSYKDPPPPYSSPHQTLDRRYDPPPYESPTTDRPTSLTALLDSASGGGASTSATPSSSDVPRSGDEATCTASSLAAFYSHV